MTLKTLIADDEPLARERLRFLLSSDDEIEIVGECRNGREVIAAIKDAAVDLLLLDIEMPGAAVLKSWKRLERGICPPLCS
jgi:two-component system, LytTR family, response regulator